MKIVFASDLHGYRARFARVFAAAQAAGAGAVLWGGDNFSYFHHATPDEAFAAQKQLFAEFLDEHLAAYDRAGIHCLISMSVHDIDGLDDQFHAICARHPFAHPLDGRKLELDGHAFIGWGHTVDHPFFCKIRCRRDLTGDGPDLQLMAPMVTTPDGWLKIAPEEWERRLRAAPSLEDDLAALPSPDDPGRAVYVFHHPPAGCGLDVVILDLFRAPLTGDLSQRPQKPIGSRAVRRFIEQRQPLLTLHGHVHESPLVTGVWRATIGRTVAVQPGQHEDGDQTHFVTADLATMQLERFTA